MMNYDIGFALSAFIYLAVIGIFFFRKQKILDQTDKIYGGIILLALLDMFFGLLDLSTMNNPGPALFFGQWLIRRLHMIIRMSLPVAFVFYAMSLADCLGKKYVLFYVPVFVPWILEMVYIERASSLVFYLVSMVYLSFGVGILVYFRKRVSLKAITTACSFAVLLFVSMSIRMFVYEWALSGMALAAAVSIVYLNFQNPEYYVDRLTGLYNREAFLYVAGKALVMKKDFNVIIIALDDFKRVNQTYGFSFADELIVRIADYLRTLGNDNQVFRYMGDQFILLVFDEEDIDSKLEKIQSRFHRTFHLKNQNVPLKASLCWIPLTKFAADAAEAAALVENSIVVSKSAAKGAVYRMECKDVEQIQRQTKIREITEIAIQTHGFEVYYQPIFSLKENRMMAAEALIRLNVPEFGTVSPEEFIPLAEKNGQILAIGDFVLHSVCEFISSSEFKETGLDYVEINVSVIQCMQEGFLESVLDILRFYNVSPDKISFEITETSMAVSEKELKSIMQKFCKAGIRLCMDDFGSGYSNLGNMQELPFSIVKLDKTVFWKYCKNSESFSVLRALSVMVRTMKKEIVVEGVETEGQLEMARKLHMHFVQGYYYSEPLPKKKFIRYMEQVLSGMKPAVSQEISI